MSKSASAWNGSSGPDGGALVAPRRLQRICEWIERDNPEAARRVARAIYDGCAGLKQFPNMGRASVRLPGRRELTFAPLPYIVVYQVKTDAVGALRRIARPYVRRDHTGNRAGQGSNGIC
jgi:plasmid stabilization system protein ParE